MIDDLLEDWRRANPDHTSRVRVVAHRWSDRAHDLKLFLARNHAPYHANDVERDDEGSRWRDLAGASATDLPLVLVPGGAILRSPTTLELAGSLGLHTSASTRWTRWAGRARWRVSTRVEGGHLVVEVADTGPGMPADVAARAFEAFYTTKDVGKGTGLGLDIARRIVDVVASSGAAPASGLRTTCVQPWPAATWVTDVLWEQELGHGSPQPRGGARTVRQAMR